MTVQAKTEELIANKEVLVFDFDGVLFDSVSLKADIFQTMYERHGADVSAQVRAYHLDHGGASRSKKFEYFESVLLGRTPARADIEILSDRFRDLYKSRIASLKPLPGAIEFVRKISDKKLLVINSAAPGEEILEILNLNMIDGCFKAVYDGKNSKPENFARLLKDHTASTEDAVFFGDTKHDMQAADAVGVDFIAVGQELSRLRRSGSFAACIEDFTGLL